MMKIENLSYSSLNISNGMNLYIEILFLGNCLRKYNKRYLKCLILSSCVQNYEYLLFNIQSLWCVFLIENSWSKLNAFHFFLYYLFVYDDPLLICGPMIVNSKETILRVVYILADLFDTLVLELCGQHLLDANLLVQLWESPWLLKPSCHLYSLGTSCFLMGLLESVW